MTANCTQNGAEEVTPTSDSIALLSTKQQIRVRESDELCSFFSSTAVDTIQSGPARVELGLPDR